MSSTADNICKDGASKSNNDGVCDVNNMLQNMSLVNNKEDVSVCANCGKEGDDVNNICNKCKKAKYCNAVCKKVHKKKHKRDCEEHIRIASQKHNEQLRIAAELHDIELFKQQPSQHGDCPICFVCLPSLETGSKYYACCGKMICSGCVYAPLYDNQGNQVDNQKCPFCRTPHPKAEKEAVEREKKRIEVEDPIAIYNLGNYYRDGRNGMPQVMDKALELWHRSAEFGCTAAYCNIGLAYHLGQGVDVDQKKAKHYWELAAMGGDEVARCNLGNIEDNAGNFERALKHYMIAAGDGSIESINNIRTLYSDGRAAKEDYTKALQAYQKYLGDIKSVQRDKAAAYSERYRYY